MTGNRHVLILTALKSEATAILKALAADSVAHDKAIVKVIGMRAVLLNSVLAAVSMTDVSTIILAGLAGGLEPDLTVGEVVVDAPTGDLGIPVDVRLGRIQTCNHIVCSPEEKRRIGEQSGAVAVDMEQSIVEAAAKSLNVPLIGVRVISDAAGDELDPDMENWIDDIGRPKARVILTALIRRPSRIASMLSLGRNTAFALSKLGETVRAIVKTL